MNLSSSVYDILTFVFDNYTGESGDLELDYEAIAMDLVDEGFEPKQVKKAFSWLESLSEPIPTLANAQQSQRIFSDTEQVFFTSEAMGFIHYLVNIGLIGVNERERIIDRAIALDCDRVDEDMIQWVSLMVLCNNAEDSTEMLWLEDLVFHRENELPAH